MEQGGKAGRWLLIAQPLAGMVGSGMIYKGSDVFGERGMYRFAKSWSVDSMCHCFVTNQTMRERIKNHT